MALEFADLKLGKQDHKFDERTLRLARFALPDIRVPVPWDFDKGRRPIPIRMWGNDANGDCVIAAQSNHLLRLERVEQRRTIPLFDKDCVDRYRLLTGSQEAGDSRDEGLVALDSMRDWNHNGYQTPKRNYKIAAYGELDVLDMTELQMAAFIFHGIHFGFWLPVAARRMTSQGVWDYNGESSPEFQPGSWGGHMVYSKAFDNETFEILTWGIKVKVTHDFIRKYCDEAWAVVDSFDSWRTRQTIDVPGLTRQLFEISPRVNQ